MALQTIRYGLGFPNTDPTNNAIGLNSYQINAAGDQVGQCFYAPETGDITKLGFRLGTVNASDTISVELQGVTSGGVPDDTAKTGATATQAGIASNTWYELTLGTPHSATKGERLAIVIKNGAGGGDFNVHGATVTSGLGVPSTVPSFCTDIVAAAWIQVASRALVGSVAYGSTYYPIPNLHPAPDGTTILTNKTTTTNNVQIGMRFQVPFPCRVVGARHFTSYANDLTLTLWDSDGTSVLDSFAVVGNDLVTYVPGMYPFDTPQAINKDTWYRISITPSAAALVNLYTCDAPTGLMGCFPNGNLCHYTYTAGTPTAEGDWTNDTNTYTAGLIVLLDQFDDGVSAGGGGAPGNMQGGMQ